MRGRPVQWAALWLGGGAFWGALTSDSCAAPAKRGVTAPHGLYTQAGKLYSSRKYPEALAAYRKYLEDTAEIKPATRAMVKQRIGVCLRSTKQYDEALAQLDHVLASYKNLPIWWATHVHRGEVLVALKRYDEARQAVATGLRASKPSVATMAQAYRTLVTCCLQENDPQAALPYAKRMYELSSLSGTVSAINVVCDCYKRIDGDINPNVREFLEFQKHGPNGPDGKPGTGDELTNPLDAAPPADEQDLAEFAREAVSQLAPCACTDRGRLWMLAGDYLRALREFMNAYSAAALETTNARSPSSCVNGRTEMWAKGRPEGRGYYGLAAKGRERPCVTCVGDKVHTRDA